MDDAPDARVENVEVVERFLKAFTDAGRRRTSWPSYSSPTSALSGGRT
jgi:hypothetical protein